jgi:hypothetical protein
MKIQCSNSECRTENDQTLFNVNLTVDGDRQVAEEMRKIPAEYFVCCFCQSTAEDVAETEEGTFNG